MSAESGFKKTFGVYEDQEQESLKWWGHASSQTRIKAWLVAIALAIVSFLVFRWLVGDSTLSPNLVASIISILTALNLVQAWERSTI